MKLSPEVKRWKQLFKADVHQTAGDFCQEPPSRAAETARALGPRYLTGIALQLESDSAAQFVRHLPEEFRERVLAGLPSEKTALVREILAHPAGTAGAIMAKEYLSVRDDVSVGETIAYLRSVPGGRKGKVSYIYAVNAEGRLEGVIQARDLVFYPPDLSVREILRGPVVQVETGMAQADVAKLLQRHRYLGLPVVDEAQRLVGVVNADRALQALQQEATDDIAKMVGTSAEEMSAPSVRRIVRLRLPWLSVNLAGGLLCAFILGWFEKDPALVASLVLFVPVVLGLSESMGVQSATIVVRHLTVEMHPPAGRLVRLLAREFAAGTLVGAICGAVVGLCSWLWKKDAALGLALAGAIIPAIWISAAIGLSLPFLFRRLKTDPAIAAGPLTLALCDVQTLVVYFWLAGNFLKSA